MNQHLSIGVIERSKEGATLWCTNLVFGPAGRLLSRHRKFQPTAAERVVWSQGSRYNDDGEDNHPVVETAVGKIGGLICWESELRAKEPYCSSLLMCVRLYAPGSIQSVPAGSRNVRTSNANHLTKTEGANETSYLAPTADARPTWLPTMQHIAQEGRCLVISGQSSFTK